MVTGCQYPDRSAVPVPAAAPAPRDLSGPGSSVPGIGKSALQGAPHSMSARRPCWGRRDPPSRIRVQGSDWQRPTRSSALLQHQIDEQPFHGNLGAPRRPGETAPGRILPARPRPLVALQHETVSPGHRTPYRPRARPGLNSAPSPCWRPATRSAAAARLAEHPEWKNRSAPGRAGDRGDDLDRPLLGYRSSPRPATALGEATQRLDGLATEPARWPARALPRHGRPATREAARGLEKMRIASDKTDVGVTELGQAYRRDAGRYLFFPAARLPAPQASAELIGNRLDGYDPGLRRLASTSTPMKERHLGAARSALHPAGAAKPGWPLRLHPSGRHHR